MEAAEELPRGIITALAAALESQHRTVMSEVRQAISTSEAATATVLDAFTGRLASQMDELGDRFDRQLVDLRDQVQVLIDVRRVGMRARPNAGEPNHALRAEIDKLMRVVAGTIELLGKQASASRLRPDRSGSNQSLSEAGS